MSERFPTSASTETVTQNKIEQEVFLLGLIKDTWINLPPERTSLNRGLYIPMPDTKLGDLANANNAQNPSELDTVLSDELGISGSNFRYFDIGENNTDQHPDDLPQDESWDAILRFYVQAWPTSLQHKLVPQPHHLLGKDNEHSSLLSVQTGVYRDGKVDLVTFELEIDITILDQGRYIIYPHGAHFHHYQLAPNT